MELKKHINQNIRGSPQKVPRPPMHFHLNSNNLQNKDHPKNNNHNEKSRKERSLSFGKNKFPNQKNKVMRKAKGPNPGGDNIDLDTMTYEVIYFF